MMEQHQKNKENMQSKLWSFHSVSWSRKNRNIFDPDKLFYLIKRWRKHYPNLYTHADIEIPITDMVRENKYIGHVTIAVADQERRIILAGSLRYFSRHYPFCEWGNRWRQNACTSYCEEIRRRVRDYSLGKDLEELALENGMQNERSYRGKTGLLPSFLIGPQMG